MQAQSPPQKKHKDKIFVRIFSEPKAALSLFNAINGTSYTDENELSIITLEDAVYVGWKNDVAILCHNELQLYEQQSTRNPNMPLRDFIYCVHEYEGFIKRNELDIYGNRIVKIPTPKCIMFYNGVDQEPEYFEYHLSDAFINPTLGYEWTVFSYNINPGFNKALMNSCHRLEGYSVFVDQIRQNQKEGIGLEKAIKMSVDFCIAHNYLKDFLQKQSGEALNMILSLYDEELHNRTIREEGREEGREEMISSMLQYGMPLEAISTIAKTSIADIVAIQNNNSSKINMSV